MKVLEALIRAYGWQGGTIHQAITALPAGPKNETVYDWGYREGVNVRHGLNIGEYLVPVNSWEPGDDALCVTSYVRGVLDGMDDAKKQVK